MTDETKLKISLRNQGVSVKVFDKLGKLINEFPTLTSAANYFGCSYTTMSNIYKTGISYDDLIYKFEIKDTRIWIYDSYLELIEILAFSKDVVKAYNICSSTLSDYIKSGKLFRKNYYFFNAKIIDNLNRACAQKD
uniref:Nuclease-associated modular DNA-binding 1 domain-containing protein n=1 Tax=Chrysoporthe deuterocubensis TaxID=764597 RepID=A0A191MX62_9PEZI|nr:hypothetical protein [Chrysoporthe deuterocubensis]AMX22194.1 hypothetical protein [Chrysoporthe deuterocubensis]